MTRLSSTLVSSLTLALVLPLVPVPALASGPGGVVWNFTASSPEQAREIREGLELLSQNNRGPSRGPARQRRRPALLCQEIGRAHV